MDTYFSVDVETDGPIPGPYSMLSFAVVSAGVFDGKTFKRSKSYYDKFYFGYLKPISDLFESAALAVNKLDRAEHKRFGRDPQEAMTDVAEWVLEAADGTTPILVAYPLGFDWMWLHWYFVKFSKIGSPFRHSSGLDIKTMYAAKAGVPISRAGASKLPEHLKSSRVHSHHALDDAIEQAEIFSNVFEWEREREISKDDGNLQFYSCRDQ